MREKLIGAATLSVLWDRARVEEAKARAAAETAVQRHCALRATVARIGITMGRPTSEIGAALGVSRATAARDSHAVPTVWTSVVYPDGWLSEALMRHHGHPGGPLRGTADDSAAEWALADTGASLLWFNTSRWDQPGFFQVDFCPGRTGDCARDHVTVATFPYVPGERGSHGAAEEGARRFTQQIVG